MFVYLNTQVAMQLVPRDQFKQGYKTQIVIDPDTEMLQRDIEN